MTRYFSLFCILCLFSFNGFSQYHELQIRTVSNELGVSPGATFSIAEDQQGFIWFGTLGGLVRYDGYNYKVFKHNQVVENSLSNNMIRALHADREGIIWVGTQGGGLNRFDPRYETFTHYKTNPIDATSISSNDIWAIEEDEDGNLWIGTWSGGLNKFDRQTGKFTRYALSSENVTVQEDGIRSVLARGDEIWVGMEATGLFKLKVSTGELTHYTHSHARHGSIASNSIYTIFTDKDNHLWVGTFSGGLNLYDERTDTFTVFQHNPDRENSLGSNNVYHITQSHSGDLWLAHDRKGISIFDYQTNTFSRFKQDKCMDNSLSSDRVRFILQDSNGIIWAGNEIGVDKLIENKNFVVYRHDPGNTQSLNTRVVRSIYEDRKGLLWVGAYDAPTLNYDRSRQRYIKTGKIIQTVGNSAITSMLEDSLHYYWVGTSNGIFVFDAQQNLIRRYLKDADSENTISDNTIQVIKKGRGDTLWIGTENGLNILNTSTGRWTRFQSNALDSSSLGSNKIQPNALIPDDDGTVWVGTWAGGLNRYIPAENRFKRYMHIEGAPNGINNNNVISLHKDGDILWIGTFGGGLNRLDTRTGIFEAFTENDGLPNNIVYAILPDKEGYLWLTTDNGLSRYDPKTRKFLNFDVSDGLPVNQFFWGASFLSPSGEMFLGTTDGMISFFPENIKLNSRVPTLTLTDVKVFKESLSFEKSIAYVEQLNFGYDVLGFQIEFSALDYMVPQKNQYAYKIAGHEENWVNIGNRNFISFANMAPGKYYLTIRGANNDGLWDEKGLTLLIHIHPPFWKTLWFSGLIMLNVFLAFMAFYKFRTHKVKRQKRVLEEEVQQRTGELGSANEELRSANEELHNQREELATANEELYSQREELEATLNKLQSTQSQLVHSEKMASLGVLAAGVAHEINNPLNFIHGGITSIEDYLKDNHQELLPQITPLFDIVYTGVKRAAGIVDSLNHYSRRDYVAFARCDIHLLIDSCLRMLEGHLKDRITVVKDFWEQPAVIRCNEGKIHQAILNILTNAMHAIPGKGEITIATHMEMDQLVVRVTDTGSGISPEILPKITDPFFTTKEPGKGTGLGLSITHNIIDEHGGSMEFDSTPGKGTTVEIFLPR